MAGRKRKPSAIRKLEGNPGKRPIPLEPEYANELPAPPAELKGRGLKEWHRLAPVLLRQRVLTEADWSVFVQYCEATGRYLDLLEIRDKERDGSEEWQRIDRAIDRAVTHLGRARAELGLTPVTRSKVARAPEKEQKKAELVAFDGGKR